MSIVRTVQLRTTNSPLVSFVDRLGRGELDVEAPYQRGEVWGYKRKVALIQSVTMGLPIGSIYISDRPFPEHYTVIDGKQRILAAADWINGDILVPREWFDDDMTYRRDVTTVNFLQLTERGRRLWTNQAHAQVYWSDFKGAKEEIEAQERALFDLINFGGVPQGESDHND